MKEPYIAGVLILINYKNGCNNCKIFNHQHEESYQKQQKNTFANPSQLFLIKYLYDYKEFVKRNTATMVTKQRLSEWNFSISFKTKIQNLNYRIWQTWFSQCSTNILLNCICATKIFIGAWCVCVSECMWVYVSICECMWVWYARSSSCHTKNIGHFRPEKRGPFHTLIETY